MKFSQRSFQFSDATVHLRFRSGSALLPIKRSLYWRFRFAPPAIKQIRSDVVTPTRRRNNSLAESGDSGACASARYAQRGCSTVS